MNEAAANCFALQDLAERLEANGVSKISLASVRSLLYDHIYDQPPEYRSTNAELMPRLTADHRLMRRAMSGCRSSPSSSIHTKNPRRYDEDFYLA